MRKIIKVISLVLLTACSDQPKYNYSIINEDIDEVFYKINIDVRLKEEISKTDLRNIALELKENRNDYNNIRIFYFLLGHKLGNGAWATTHFKPELEVEILGATKDALVEMNSIEVTGGILNSWFDNDPMLPNKKYLVKEKGKLFFKSIYAKSKLTGSVGEMIEEVVEIKQNDGIIRYDYDNNHGEYYLIETNGNLGLYDDSGKFMEAIKIE